MKYIGLQAQIRRNNQLSLMLLICFPFIVAFVTLAVAVAWSYVTYKDYYDSAPWSWELGIPYFKSCILWVFGFVGLWMVIAYFWQTSIIGELSNSKRVSSTDASCTKLLSIVEKLSITAGIPMPEVRIIDSYCMNAFASGINNNNFTITVTTSLLKKLNDVELEGVIAHELSHIINRDSRLLIIGLIVTGTFQAFISFVIAMLSIGKSFMSGEKEEGILGGAMLLTFGTAWMILSVGYISSLLTRLCISRKREYLADAGAAELTANPSALASALRKISGNPNLNLPMGLSSLLIASPIVNMRWWQQLWSTHPDINKRIEILEQMDTLNYSKL